MQGDDARKLVKRAALWFGGRLPAEEQMESYSVHVTGPAFDPEDPLGVTYHTFACLYPDRGMYVVMGTTPAGTENPAWKVTGPQIRDIIAGFTPSEEHVIAQRKLAGAAMPGSTIVLRWDAAVTLGALFELPVAVIAFGHSRTHELVAYQQSIMITPLVKLATVFKGAAPRVILN
jgi:hypothetical protein